MNTNFKPCCFRLLSAALLAAPVVINAAVSTIDLTYAGAPGGFGPSGSIFRLYSIGSGTGNFDPFLALSDGGASPISGYSTDASSGSGVGTQQIDASKTRSLTYGDLRYVTEGGTDYVRFLLDINEPSGGFNSLLVLSDLQIFAPTTSPENSATYSGSIVSMGAPLFDLGDTRVLMDYSLQSGSGTSDIEALIPLSLFSGILSTNQRIVFYSEFGNTNGLIPSKGFPQDAGGFEEWRFDIGNPLVPPPPPPPPVPEPATFAFAGVLVAGLAFAEVRRRRKS